MTRTKKVTFCSCSINIKKVKTAVARFTHTVQYTVVGKSASNYANAMIELV